MKRLIIATLALMVMVGCTKDDGEISNDSSVAQFTTATAVTRVVSDATSSTWVETTDAIGISSNNSDLNVKYTAESTGDKTVFTFADTDASKKILLPNTGTVIYSAYYPYTSESYYTSNVSVQSDLGAIDFLVASGATGSEESGSIKFEFEHALSMLKFTIKKGDSLDSGVSLEDIEVSLGDVTTVANYDFTGTRNGDSATTGSINLNVTYNDDGTATALAIVNPITIAATTLTFKIAEYNGNEFTCTFPELTPLAGNIYSYNITLGYDAASFKGTADLDTTVYDDSIEKWETDNDEPLWSLDEIPQGTVGNPFVVGSQDDLEKIGSPDGDLPWDASAHYELTEDITISGTFTSNISADNPFYGVLDGGGHKITGLTNVPGDDDYAGLLPYIGEGGQVYNLTIENCEITQDSEPYMGVIAGINKGTISNCTVSGSITNTYNDDCYCGVGGIVGRNHSLVERCVNNATVEGNWKVGGIVGYLDYSHIVSCGNTGTVTNNTPTSANSLTQQGTGGIVGYCDSKTHVLSCYNQGEVKSVGYYAGGIAGYTNGVVLYGCYNTGKVDGAHTVGSVVGRVHSTHNYVMNCYYKTECRYVNLVASADLGIGTNGDVEDETDNECTLSMSDDNMKDESFESTLNTAAAAANLSAKAAAIEMGNGNIYSDVTVYGWTQDIDSYPVTDPEIATVPE